MLKAFQGMQNLLQSRHVSYTCHCLRSANDGILMFTLKFRYRRCVDLHHHNRRARRESSRRMNLNVIYVLIWCILVLCLRDHLLSRSLHATDVPPHRYSSATAPRLHLPAIQCTRCLLCIKLDPNMNVESFVIAWTKS
jgi:hypothetical protein